MNERKKSDKVKGSTMGRMWLESSYPDGIAERFPREIREFPKI